MNIIFQASAGTGKTYQVTALYVAILLGKPCETVTADGKTVKIYFPENGPPADPRRILLMTFTDNAAAELRSRATQWILRARYEAEDRGDMETVEATVRILRALPSSPICTIHSFCAGFLREHALEAGLSPGFSVLDQDESDALLDEVCREELLGRLRHETSNPAYDPDFENFCAGVRVLGGGEFTTTIVDAVRSLIRQAASQGIGLQDAEHMLPPPEHKVSRADFEAILEEMKAVRAGRGGELPAGAARVFQTLEKNLEIFPIIGKNAEKSSKDWKIEEFVAALQAAGKLNFSGGSLTAISNRLKENVESVRLIADYRAHYSELRSFARYAAAVAVRFAERKAQLNALDFDDLLTRTRALLPLPGSDAKASNHFDFIIVDEVQDTSRVQCEIIQALWKPGVNRLVICGDTKQSIYAWRNADPRVMPDLAQSIKKSGEFKQVPLQASYRSKDRILDLVNLLFQQVYGENYTEDEQLIPAKARNAWTGKLGEGPCVEFLTAAWDSNQKPEVRGQRSEDSGQEEDQIPEAEKRVTMEMEAVANRIQLLVNGPPKWHPHFRADDTEGKFAPADKLNRYRYSDILILLRRTTNQQTLEHVLKSRNIPYRIGGKGQGLFARPEAKDILLFLRVLKRPFDAIALVGFLRSPWIGLSDEAILQLGWAHDGFDEELFRNRVLSEEGEKILSGLFDDQSARLRIARLLITEFRAQVGYELASDLVRNLLEKTGYDAIISGAFRGAQRMANLRKLIDWLRTAERGGTVLLSDVLSMLEKNADRPPDIPEAVLLDPEQNAVTLMTVHAAKGLTSRVVFVPELGAIPPPGSTWTVLQMENKGKPVLHLNTDAVDRHKIQTPGFESARDLAKSIRDAESKNVFYVALTRAQDLVVLSGARGSRKPDAWRRALDTLLQENPKAKDLIKAIPYEDLEPGSAPSHQIPAEPPSQSVFEQISRRFIHLQVPPRILRFPATVLSAYHADPEEYARTKLAGRESAWYRKPRPPDEPEHSGDDVAHFVDDDLEGTYAYFGTAGHEVLEQLALNQWRGDTERWAETAGTANRLRGSDIQDLKARLSDACKKLKTLFPRNAEFRAEWPFALTLTQGPTTLIVDGTIDLFFQGRDGRWHIIDYKFTDDSDGHLLKKYGLQLNLYREALQRRSPNSRAEIVTALAAISGKGFRLIEVPAAQEIIDNTIHSALELHRWRTAS